MCRPTSSTGSERFSRTTVSSHPCPIWATDHPPLKPTKGELMKRMKKLILTTASLAVRRLKSVATDSSGGWGRSTRQGRAPTFGGSTEDAESDTLRHPEPWWADRHRRAFARQPPREAEARLKRQLAPASHSSTHTTRAHGVGAAPTAQTVRWRRRPKVRHEPMPAATCRAQSAGHATASSRRARRSISAA